VINEQTIQHMNTTLALNTFGGTIIVTIFVLLGIITVILMVRGPKIKPASTKTIEESAIEIMKKKISDGFTEDDIFMELIKQYPEMPEVYIRSIILNLLYHHIWTYKTFYSKVIGGTEMYFQNTNTNGS
jgi:hypothetical protein